MAHTGILKRLFSDKGYGFIHNESDERDVFVHFSELRWFSKEDLTEGTEVAFDIEQQSGRTKAINVTPRESQAGAWAWAGELSSSDHLVPWVPGHSTEPPRASAAWERTISPHEWNDGWSSQGGFASELRTWLHDLDHGQGEMLRFAEAISWHYHTWEALLEGSIQDTDVRPVLLTEDFHRKIGLRETGHTIRIAAGLGDMLDRGWRKIKEAEPETSSQPDSGRQAQPDTEDSDRDSDAENEGCIRIFVCIMARGVELSLSLPVAATIGEVMAKLEELEGVEHGTQHLFSLSRPWNLLPEEVLEDGAELFLSSPEDERMLSLLPEHIRPHLNPASLVDVVLDLDRKPVVHERDAQGKLCKRVLDGCPLVQQEDLDAAEAHELLAGRWTKDNRSGVSGTLHRVARIVDHYGGRSLTGLTLRMAHAMYGLAENVPQLRRVIEDGKSLLVLGPPGCGKTTLLREVARSLSEEFNRRVFVIDTSSEICGFGRSAHVAVGRTTRRMQVADRSLQHQDMLEAVQNHTPEVLVIDEIGSQEEVEAACRIGFKGIALVATAHANNLKEAMDNVALQSLFGGFQTSTVSDQTAQRSADGRKFVEQRRSAPVFKSLVELGRGSGDEWVVYEDLEGAIDMILARKPGKGSRVPAPSHIRMAKPGPGQRVGREMQELTPPARKVEQIAETVPCIPEVGGRIAPEELKARKSMRDREISGRAYRLCFDGGVDGGHHGPGGAGAILRRLRAGTGHPDRRTGKTWMLYHPKSCPELMEYAGLLIGLRGIKQSLPTLQPAPEVIFIEGDCKLVVDRHGGGPVAQSLRSEHPDVEAKLDALAQLVDEAIRQLERKNVTVDLVKWRNRGRNKAADRLSHEAREWQHSTFELESEVFSLLRAFEVSQVPTVWQLKEVHPMLRIQGGVVMHPRHLVGLVGFELKPDSADGSFSISVQVDGRWSKHDSFSLGLVPSGAADFTRAQGLIAGEIGFWFSPKSGNICGMLGGQKAEFVLPSWMGKLTGSVADRKKASLLPGTRWGMTYRRGSLELFMAMPDSELESLGCVQWPWGEVVPQRTYSAAVFFKPRRSGSGSIGWPTTEKPKSINFIGRPPSSPCQPCLPCLRLLGDGLAAFRTRGWKLWGEHPGLGFLYQLPEAEALHVRCCRKCFALRSRDMDAENFLRELEIDNLVDYLEWHRRPVLDTGLPTLEISRGVEVSARDVLFPQRRFERSGVQFRSGGRRLALKVRGKWTNRESFLLGITPERCDFQSQSCMADLGFFFSPRSRSAIGLDGTNFSWPDSLEEVWCQQLEEQSKVKFDEVVGTLPLEHREGVSWCIQRTDENELAVFYKPAAPVKGIDYNEWVLLGLVPWKTSILKQWDHWFFTIAFKPLAGGFTRDSLPTRVPGPSLGHGCGMNSPSPREAGDLPRVEVLSEEDLAGDFFGTAPSVERDIDGCNFRWDGPKVLVQRLRACAPSATVSRKEAEENFEAKAPRENRATEWGSTLQPPSPPVTESFASGVRRLSWAWKLFLTFVDEPSCFAAAPRGYEPQSHATAVATPSAASVISISYGNSSMSLIREEAAWGWKTRLRRTAAMCH
eukprot:s1516_g2.t1